MKKGKNVPDKAELRIQSETRLSPERVGVEFGVKITDAEGAPVEGWPFSVYAGEEELIKGATDKQGGYKGQRVLRVREGVSRDIFLVLEGSSVSDWKKVQKKQGVAKERERGESEARRIKDETRLKDILEGKGGVIKTGETMCFPHGEYMIKEDIEVESGGTLIIKPGTIMRFTQKKGITCEGVMKAEGIEENPIHFTGLNDSSRWRNIVVRGPKSEGSCIAHCLIEHGTGEEYGGGLHIDRSPKIELSNCTFQNNVGGCGGGVACRMSNVEMKEIEMRGNKATKTGGGIYIVGGDTKIDSININGNQSGDSGGGIGITNQWITSEDGPPPEDCKKFNLKITNTKISGNNAAEGGGVWIKTGFSGPTLNGMIDGLISGNNAKLQGTVNNVQYTLYFTYDWVRNTLFNRHRTDTSRNDQRFQITIPVKSADIFADLDINNEVEIKVDDSGMDIEDEGNLYKFFHTQGSKGVLRINEEVWWAMTDTERKQLFLEKACDKHKQGVIQAVEQENYCKNLRDIRLTITTSPENIVD